LSGSDDDANDHVNHNANQENEGKNTTAQVRQGIYEALLERSTCGKLKRKSTSLYSSRTISFQHTYSATHMGGKLK
jgi:hypothetical protein